MKKFLVAFLMLTMTTLASGLQTATEWVKYTSVVGHYSVLEPQQPQLKSQETTLSAGVKFTQYVTQAMDSDGVYEVSYFDYTPDINYSLDTARDSMVNAVKGTVLSEEAINLGGYAGRAFVISAKLESGTGTLMHARIYDIGRRVYLLQHLFLKSSDSSAMGEKTTKFFDSFKVTNP
jgi:hypothetical protein